MEGVGFGWPPGFPYTAYGELKDDEGYEYGEESEPPLEIRAVSMKEVVFEGVGDDVFCCLGGNAAGEGECPDPPAANGDDPAYSCHVSFVVHFQEPILYVRLVVEEWVGSLQSLGIDHSHRR